ncbi:MAG: VTT domain-containing protein [Spirochaetes bacterium]|nr:VTT domain-containing protein [Spirochaetota bacterium]
MLKKHLSKMIFAIFFILFLIVFFVFKLNRFFTYENISSVREFILDFSILGPIIIILLYIVFNLAVFPTFYFIFLSAYLYGPVFGFMLGWFGMIIGFMASFLNSRYIFRKDFVEKFGSNKVVLKLENYTKKYNGWAVIFFRIFFIIPYNFQNIAYGLSSINAFIYMICSAIGILPTTILYVWLGYSVANNKIGINDLKSVFLYTGIFITVFASIFFTSIILKKKLRLSMDQ